VLEKLLQKLAEIHAMGDRVFDVIGQLLQLNDIRFEEMVKLPMPKPRKMRF